MPYRFMPGQSIGSEVRRLADRQLELAIANLQDTGGRLNDKAVHGARRHIKKIRALIRLCESSLGKRPRAADRRLRTVSRLLAPMADGEAVVDTLRSIAATYHQELPRTVNAVHRRLVKLELAAGREARADKVLQAATRLLRAERAQVPRWRFHATGFRAVRPGLERSVRRTRRAMARALAQPTPERYHVWRQRVKDLWLQVRLLQKRCGGQLARQEQQLELLDGCLGEYHNCVLLEKVLIAERPVRRRETALWLHLIRRYQRRLRREMQPLTVGIRNETPRQVSRHVRRLWREAKAVARPAPKTREGTWRRAA